jgi:hypothetical protein
VFGSRKQSLNDEDKRFLFILISSEGMRRRQGRIRDDCEEEKFWSNFASLAEVMRFL